MTKLHEILVPTVDNKGVPFSSQKTSDLLTQIAVLVGGFTVNNTNTAEHRGGWIDPSGRLVVDVLSPLRVACTAEELGEVCALIAKTLDQRSVMAYEVSPQVYFYFNKA